MGMVYFPSFAPWWMEARQELLQFPFGARDDFVDALAWIGSGLGAQASPGAVKARKPGIKTGTLGWVKQSSIAEKRKLNSAEKAGW